MTAFKIYQNNSFEEWRQSFNDLVDSVGKKSYFKTPQDWGAVGDGINDDTSAFDQAVLSSYSSILVPPGSYKLTKSYDVNGSYSTKFFTFGGVTFVNPNTGITRWAFNLNANIPESKSLKLSTQPTKFGSDTNQDMDKAVTKGFVWQQFSDLGLTQTDFSGSPTFASKISTDHTYLNASPVSGNWYNQKYLLTVNTSGVTQLGNTVYFHNSSNSVNAFDVKMVSSNDSSNNYLSISDSTGVGRILADLTNGYLQITSNATPGTEVLMLNSNKLTSIDPLFGIYNPQGFLYATMIDDHGGARIKGLYHNGLNRGKAALLLEGVRNDNGQNTNEFATVSVNAYSLTLNNGSVIGTGSNFNDNIFGVYNNSSNRLVIKGSGALYQFSDLSQGTSAKIFSINNRNREYAYVTGDGRLRIGHIYPPVNISGALSTTGGALVNGQNYYIKIVSVSQNTDITTTQRNITELWSSPSNPTTGIHISNATSKITYTWDVVPGAVKYLVFFTTDLTQDFVNYFETTTNSYVLSTSSGCKTINYSVFGESLHHEDLYRNFTGTTYRHHGIRLGGIHLIPYTRTEQVGIGSIGLSVIVGGVGESLNIDGNGLVSASENTTERLSAAQSLGGGKELITGEYLHEYTENHIFGYRIKTGVATSSSSYVVISFGTNFFTSCTYIGVTPEFDSDTFYSANESITPITDSVTGHITGINVNLVYPITNGKYRWIAIGV